MQQGCETKRSVSMKEMVEVLAKHGYWILFVAILGRQACLPVPANLLLLAAGALAGMGKLNFLGIVVFSLTAFLLADLAWYQAGQRFGDKTLHFISATSRDPGARVDKIVATFSRHGVKWLLVSKFIIGLDAVAVPMSGISEVSLPRFLAFDALGALLWACAYTALGYVFSDQLDRVATYSTKIGEMAVLAGAAVLGVLVVRKLVRLYHFFCEFRLARITPDQLKSKLVAGENILLLDLQGSEAYCEGLMGIPGSVRIDPHLLRRYERQYRNVNLSVDREVVLYCANPGERLSVRVALALRRRGFERVRPLAGGLEAWRNCNFPVTRDIQMLPPPEHAVYLLRELLHYSPMNSAQTLKTSIADVDQLLERAQERVGNSEDIRLIFLQHFRQQEVAQSTVSTPATGPLGHASMTE